ncbi:hypothetical protein [Burkholderia alba]|uniref:hypothetical protein n=1 Tax=Burkholderia alba TaxID=2683677 RepID=UPI002B053350|nr:hypothetical protein [Burkholderia alba]
MDIQLAANRLSALASASNRPKAAQLRDLFEHVENAIRAGVRYAAIIEELAALGLHFTYQTFAVTLKRIRRQRGMAPLRGPHAVSRVPAALSPNHEPSPATASVPLPPAPSLTTTSAASRLRAPTTPAATLPDDWLTSDTLTLDQKRLLTRDQRRARAESVVERFSPNPIKAAQALINKKRDAPA